MSRTKRSFQVEQRKKQVDFVLEQDPTATLRLPLCGSRVMYHCNGSCFRQRPKQKALLKDLANFEVLRDV